MPVRSSSKRKKRSSNPLSVPIRLPTNPISLFQTLTSIKPPHCAVCQTITSPKTPLLPLPACSCTLRLATPPLPTPLLHTLDPNNIPSTTTPSSLPTLISTLKLDTIQLQTRHHNTVCKPCVEKMILTSNEILEHEYHDDNQPNPRFSVEVKCPICKTKFMPRVMERVVKLSSQSGCDDEWGGCLVSSGELEKGMRVVKRMLCKKGRCEGDAAAGGGDEAAGGGDVAAGGGGVEEEDEDECEEMPKRLLAERGEVLNDLMERDPKFKQSYEDEQYIMNQLKTPEGKAALGIVPSEEEKKRQREIEEEDRKLALQMQKEMEENLRKGATATRLSNNRELSNGNNGDSLNSISSVARPAAAAAGMASAAGMATLTVDHTAILNSTMASPADATAAANPAVIPIVAPMIVPPPAAPRRKSSKKPPAKKKPPNNNDDSKPKPKPRPRKRNNKNRSPPPPPPVHTFPTHLRTATHLPVTTTTVAHRIPSPITDTPPLPPGGICLVSLPAMIFPSYPHNTSPSARFLSPEAYAAAFGRKTTTSRTTAPPPRVQRSHSPLFPEEISSSDDDEIVVYTKRPEKRSKRNDDRAYATAASSVQSTFETMPPPSHHVKHNQPSARFPMTTTTTTTTHYPTSPQMTSTSTSTTTSTPMPRMMAQQRPPPPSQRQTSSSSSSDDDDDDDDNEKYQNDISTLLNMGFPPDRTKDCYHDAHGDLELAISMLCSSSTEENPWQADESIID